MSRSRCVRPKNKLDQHQILNYKTVTKPNQNKREKTITNKRIISEILITHKLCTFIKRIILHGVTWPFDL